MKRLNNRISKVAVALSLIFIITSCDLFDLDINTDPNNPTVITPELLLPTVMLDASSLFAGGINSNAHGFVGGNISSADDYNLNSTSYNGLWQALYTGPIKDLDEVIKFTTAAGTYPKSLGVAQVLKAYYSSMMVDLWGDIPYFTALNGNNAAAPEKNPVYDNSVDIYKDCLALIDAAVVNLAVVSSEPLAAGDPIYRGDVTKWTKAAWSLKLRLLLQVRKSPAFSGTVAADIATVLGKTLITSTADDFQFQFAKLLQPDNRHPWYQAAYTGAENGYNYMGHQIMFEMILNRDPRFPFYFKRQSKTTLNFNDPTERATAPCTQTVGCVYGYIVLNTGSGKPIDQLQKAGIVSTPLSTADKDFLAGIFGRDRGDRAGVPLDGSLRTAPGVYPAGGYFDDAEPTTRKVANNGAFGNGIFPMITSSMVKFYQIEAALTLGTAGSARSLYESAIRESIAKVSAFGASLDANSIAPSAAAIESYVGSQMAIYDAETSNEGRLNRVLKQAWFANFGNGFEVYNATRRTSTAALPSGYPNDLKPAIATVRGFALRIPYSLNDLTLNSSAEAQKSVVFDQDRVFWDVD